VRGKLRHRPEKREESKGRCYLRVSSRDACLPRSCISPNNVEVPYLLPQAPDQRLLIHVPSWERQHTTTTDTPCIFYRQHRVHLFHPVR
jgi:hypothetical protein